MAMGLALQPARLMSRETYALIRCNSKADWEKVVELSPGAVEELLFWAENLVRWNAHDRSRAAVTGEDMPRRS